MNKYTENFNDDIEQVKNITFFRWVWRKKILKNNKKTREYLESLPKIYAVVEWAKPCVLELYWSGKYNKHHIPLVYVYHDCNGACDEYRLLPIVFVTSGKFYNWYHHREPADLLCRNLNEALPNGSMTNYKKLISKSPRALAEWLDKSGQFDGSPWMKWFDKNYCSKCDSIKINRADSKDILGFELMFKSDTTCSYCEFYKKCKYFPDKEEIPSNVDIIEMWLKEQS